MGLDMGFVKRRAKTEIASLRKHHAFATSFFNFDPPPFQEPFTDFLVEAWMIDEVADQWGIDGEDVVHAEAALSKAAFERICGDCEDDYDLSELRPVYRRIIERLRSAVGGSTPLLCYYSA
ncbi:hypothetical protein [Limimaricola sp. AA108-03]|uniref:hypothetical protein n=1 Tax=Limimaricola sp. AA108-03 TaxID=3425945 RepID=UPI003D76EF5E